MMKKSKSTNLDKRDSGIEVIGEVPWGTHFCLFYQTKEDLIDILVPYFKAGLESNEYCMWVTSEPLNQKDAENAIKKSLPNFEQYLNKKQIEIIPHNEWYLKNNEFNSQRVLDDWVDKLNYGLSQGFKGLRLTGNTFWLEEKDWKAFTDYEEEVNNIIGNYNMIGVCTYCLEKCGPYELLDVIHNHQFALIRREGKWTNFKSMEQIKAEEKYREAYNLVNFYKDLFAHDMNTILQAILSTTQYHSLLRNDPEELEDFGDITKIVEMHVRRGTSLISKVRTLSKLEETEIQLIPIGVFDVLDKSVENTKKSFHEKNINIQIEGLSKDLKILGDALLIDVFDNLLNNSVKFSDNDKESIVDIIISKIQADDIKYIKFEFKDNGIGIPDDRKKTLFQELFERDKSKRGMGIGLSLVKKIVDKYEGKIWVEDRIKGNYKEGSNFVVLLKESP